MGGQGGDHLGDLVAGHAGRDVAGRDAKLLRDAHLFAGCQAVGGPNQPGVFLLRVDLGADVAGNSGWPESHGQSKEFPCRVVTDMPERLGDWLLHRILSRKLKVKTTRHSFDFLKNQRRAL